MSTFLSFLAIVISFFTLSFRFNSNELDQNVIEQSKETVDINKKGALDPNSSFLTIYNNDINLLTYSNSNYYNVNADFITYIYTDYNGTQLDSFYINCSLSTFDFNNNINGSFLSQNLIFDNWSDNQILFNNILNLTLNYDFVYEVDYNLITFTFTLQFEYFNNNLSETFERSISFDYYTLNDIENIIYSNNNVYNFINFNTLLNGSYNNGYNIGYDIGNEEGYTEGYQVGLNITQNTQEYTDSVLERIWNVFTNATSVVFNVLSFQVIPGIPIFAVLIMPIIVAVVLFIFKVIGK